MPPFHVTSRLFIYSECVVGSFMTWLTAPRFALGYRASEGRDGHLGEAVVLGGHEGCVRGSVLPLLVQSLLGAHLQEDAVGAGASRAAR